MRKFLSLFVTAAAVAACSSSPEVSDPALGTTRQAIINGKASTTDQDAVVLLYHIDRSQGAFGACTGTLIAPNLVLTARHCVSSVAEAPFGCDEKGNPQGSGANAGADLSVTGFSIFLGTDRPQFGGGIKNKAAAKATKVYHDSSKVLCSHDLALLLLDREIPDAKILPLRLDAGPKEGETITAVGWGVTNTSDFPSKRQQRDGVKIIKVGPFAGGFKESPLPPNDFEVGEAICSGDSGGPAIAEATDSVIGVVSRGGNGNFDQNDPSAGCIGDNTTNIYTSVAPFKDLILQAFSDSGHEPWLEGQPDPRLAKFDEECSTNDQCRSNICYAGKCAQPCGDASECNEGLTCGAADGNKICLPPAPKNAATTTTSGGCALSGSNGSFGGFAPLAFAAAAALVARRRRKMS